MVAETNCGVLLVDKLQMSCQIFPMRGNSRRSSMVEGQNLFLPRNVVNCMTWVPLSSNRAFFPVSPYKRPLICVLLVSADLSHHRILCADNLHGTYIVLVKQLWMHGIIWRLLYANYQEWPVLLMCGSRLAFYETSAVWKHMFSAESALVIPADALTPWGRSKRA